MNYKNINHARELFYKGELEGAKEIFIENDYTYEAGLCFLLQSDIENAEKYFSIKSNYCPASHFGLIVLDIIKGKTPKIAGYFQIRSFLELFLNLLIENNCLEFAQRIIDKYDFFTRFNLEVPKFIARVLYAKGYTRAVHSFANYAKEICKSDAEIYYIDASLYIDENNIEKAMENIYGCLSFAPDYFPILKLKKSLEQKIN